jgi:hypothetical protein
MLGSTPNLPRVQIPAAPWRTSIPTLRPKTATEPDEAAVPVPGVVIPPKEYPETMRTPFAEPTGIGGVTPTFLPMKKEQIFARLGKNIVQGMVGSTGWHVFDFARNVDFFG